MHGRIFLLIVDLFEVSTIFANGISFRDDVLLIQVSLLVVLCIYLNNPFLQQKFWEKNLNFVAKEKYIEKVYINGWEA